MDRIDVNDGYVAVGLKRTRHSLSSPTDRCLTNHSSKTTSQLGRYRAEWEIVLDGCCAGGPQSTQAHHSHHKLRIFQPSTVR